MSKESHSFNPSVACEVGVPGAIIMQHFLFLQKANISGAENWQEKWVKRSAKSIAKTYPYWSGKQVASITDNLEKGEYIFSKIENASKIDRTKSFILTPKGLLLMDETPFAQMENGFSKRGNANAEMENAIPENGKCNIEEYYTSFIPSLEEEKEISSSTAEPKTFSLEAEKEKPIPPVAPAPLPVTVVEVYEQGFPVVTVYDQIPTKQYPTQEPHGEWKRVNIPDELETLKTDAAIREAFSMGRKIPSANFPEYLEAFRLDVIGRGETYANVKQLRAHFLNWSGSRFEIAQRKAAQPKPQTTNGQPAKIRQL